MTPTPTTSATYRVTVPHNRVDDVAAAIRGLGLAFEPREALILHPLDDAFSQGTFTGDQGPRLIDALNRHIRDENTVLMGPKMPEITTRWENLEHRERAALLEFACFELDWSGGECLGITFLDWQDLVRQYPGLTRKRETRP